MVFINQRLERHRSTVVSKAAVSFLLQMSLFGLLIYQFIKKNEDGKITFLGCIFVGGPVMQTTRIMCAFILHLQVVNEIMRGKQMLSFVKKSPNSFDKGKDMVFPMSFCLFKIIGGVCCMLANIIVIVHSETVDDVIKDFIAVEIIQQIDNFLADTLIELNAEELINEQEVWINVNNDKLGDCEILYYYNPGFWNWFSENEKEENEQPSDNDKMKVADDNNGFQPLTPFPYVVLVFTVIIGRIISFFIQVFYFYFAPFVITALTIMAQTF